MAGFNTQSVRTKKPDTVNKDGHVAYSMGDHEKLVTQVLTTFFNEPKFYGDTSQELIDLAKKVCTVNPLFVAKLAIYARETMNMRTVSHVLAVIVCNASHNFLTPDFTGVPRRMANRLVIRGDDITNMLAAHRHGIYAGKPLPNSLRRGLRDALEGLNRISIAKYQETDKVFTMADAIKILRPKPASEAVAKEYKACLEGTLKVPESWKSAVSINEEGETKSWNELVAQNKLPYMAALRNIRNMLNDKTVTKETIKAVMQMLCDPKQVAKSRQLPFRYLTAYNAAMESSRCSTMVTDALESAFDQSVANLPKLNGRTIVCIDVSGSMDTPVSKQSTVMCNEIAKQLGYVVATMSDDAIVYTFDTRLTREDFSKRSGILSQVRALKSRGGGGTSMELPFEKAIAEKIECDRFVVLSDNVINSDGGRTVQSYADNYRDKMGKNVWVHAIDMQGYGTQQFIGNRTNILAGWSEKILEFIPLVENAEGGLLERINEVKI